MQYQSNSSTQLKTHCTRLKLNLLFQGDLVSVKNLVIQCIKYHFQPWKCRTFFNPEAEDTLSIKKKREPHEILILTLKALVCALNILFSSNQNIHKSLCCLCTSRHLGHTNFYECCDSTKKLLSNVLISYNF